MNTVPKILFGGALVVCINSFAAAEEISLKTLKEPDVLNELQTIKQADLLHSSEAIIIDKNYLFDGWFLVADKIVFKSGASLIFSQQALNTRRNFFIVAKEITSEDAGAPGTITYQKPNPDTAGATAGQAPSGAPGQSDGASGAAGPTGLKGSTGPKGFSAPSLTITTLSLKTSGPKIDFSGGVGGQGGQGQRGGDGGAGRQGSPASQSMVDCKAGGGRGGDGGAGGQGGPAGDGGQGGTGGTVKIIAPSEVIGSLTEKIRVVTAGGDGGQPGQGGPGGNAGPAGSGGQEARPYCGGGDGGRGGNPGQIGGSGTKGQPGLQGDLFVGSITPDLFAKVYK